MCPPSENAKTAGSALDLLISLIIEKASCPLSGATCKRIIESVYRTRCRVRFQGKVVRRTDWVCSRWLTRSVVTTSEGATIVVVEAIHQLKRSTMHQQVARRWTIVLSQYFCLTKESQRGHPVCLVGRYIDGNSTNYFNQLVHTVDAQGALSTWRNKRGLIINY